MRPVRNNRIQEGRRLNQSCAAVGAAKAVAKALVEFTKRPREFKPLADPGSGGNAERNRKTLERRVTFRMATIRPK
jgi:hypothetical protein